MRITYDIAKRDRTESERGLSFDDAVHVFAHVAMEIEDTRFAYGEPRFITFGYLEGRMVVVVWTPVEGGRRIISMRKANAREQARYS